MTEQNKTLENIAKQNTTEQNKTEEKWEDLDQVVEEAMKRYYRKGIKERLKNANLSALRVAYYVLKREAQQ